MPNVVGLELNRNIRATFLPGEIGVGSSNFVAFVKQSDVSRPIKMTGIRAGLSGGDTLAKSLRIYLLQNRLITPNDITNPTVVTDLANQAILFYPFALPVTPTGTIFQFSDNFTIRHYEYLGGYSYSLIFDFVVGGAGIAGVNLDLCVLGYYDELAQPYFGESR